MHPATGILAGAHTQNGFDVDCFDILPKLRVTLNHGIHCHPVGKLVALGTSVGTDVVELNSMRDTGVYGVGILDDAQILDFSTGLTPAFGLPAVGPFGDAVDGVAGV